jgi:GMP synthase-like glutamine amidotransferase
MVIILKHVAFEGPGLIADMMEGRGIPHRTIEVFDEGVPLSAAGFSGLVLMGGSMSVLDTLSEIEREKILLAEAMGRGVPVLGICLGAQILASALGARIYPGKDPEIGWGEVNLTESGMRDPLFTGVETPLSVLHWHSDTFDLPQGAVHLAFSDQYDQQAFRMGSKTYGFQFHLEVDEEMVREWVSKDFESDRLIKNSDTLTSQMRDWLDNIRLTGALVFGRFLDLVAGRGSG